MQLSHVVDSDYQLTHLILQDFCCYSNKNVLKNMYNSVYLLLTNIIYLKSTLKIASKVLSISKVYNSEKKEGQHPLLLFNIILI